MILIVGSIAYDCIKIQNYIKKNLLGGSAIYASLSASFFNKVKLVGVVGEDFKKSHINLLKNKNIDIVGVEVKKGETFRWMGSYSDDLTKRETIQRKLGVFENFKPHLPNSYKLSQYIFLANIQPELQLLVLNQIKNKKIVILDTMNCWIEEKKQQLIKLFKLVNIILLNDEEARQFTGINNLLKAGKKLLTFPKLAVIIKRGEAGCILFTDSKIISLPAYPVENVVDPTGAGDAFAGALLGYLSTIKKINEVSLKRAAVYGTILSSFTIEGFSIEKLKNITKQEIKKRFNEYQKMIKL